MKSPKLTLKQENACQAYVETGDKSEAYRRAYNCIKMKPDVINNKAYELFKRGDITARVREIQSELKKTSDIRKEAILEELACIAFSDIRDYVKFDGKKIEFKDFKELTDRQSKAIESIRGTKYGFEIRLHGKSWTIDRVCKMLGFDAPQDMNILLEKMDEATLDALVERILKKQ